MKRKRWNFHPLVLRPISQASYLVLEKRNSIVVKTVFAAITTLPNTISDVVLGTARSLPINVANNDDRDVADYV
jgi:hypothetical protein